MDQLIIDCDIGIRGENPGNLYPVIFTPVLPLPSPNSPRATTTYLPVKHVTRVPHEAPHLREHFAIFRTQLIPAFDSDPKSTLDVILKVDLRGNIGFKSLSKEAQFYETTLKPLQGRVVPRFYGHYETHVTVIHGDELATHKITCLVLQYCGEPMPEGFEKDTDVALKVVEQLVELHTAGLQHGDIQDKNILNNNGIPFFINFAQSEPHICRRTLPINKGDIAPEVYSFECREIHDWVAWETNIWFPAMFDFWGTMVFVADVESAEHLASLVTDRECTVAAETRLKLARKIVDDLKRQSHPLLQLNEDA